MSLFWMTMHEQCSIFQKRNLIQKILGGGVWRLRHSSRYGKLLQFADNQIDSKVSMSGNDSRHDQCRRLLCTPAISYLFHSK